MSFIKICIFQTDSKPWFAQAEGRAGGEIMVVLGHLVTCTQESTKTFIEGEHGE